MKAIILAAGYATRLHPLTKNLSKCLIEVKGSPIVQHIVEKIGKTGEVDKVYIVTNHKFSLSFEQWQESFKSQVPVKVIDDGTTSNEDRRGAIGDIEFVVEHENIDDNLLVIAGDNLFEFNLEKFISFFREKDAAVVALHNFPSEEDIAEKYGVVEIDSANKIVSFEEKPKKPKTNLAATACYIFPKREIAELREYVKNKLPLDNPGEFIKYLAKKKEVYGFVFKEKWYDIGSFESLGKARRDYNG